MQKIILHYYHYHKCNAFIPCKSMLYHWLSIILPYFIKKPIEITICIVNKKHIKMLNYQFLKINKTTNVLSFPSKVYKNNILFLGEIILCPDIIYQETIQYHKQIIAHYAHLIIHSILHLFTFDHDNEYNTTVMIKQEINLLHILGYTNPYIK
ncbi:rRNA maturation RNase YbeY [Enterobacteriaceae endosymbiont of Macroplea appendiculata]|uniref:rRNA maturation RNase YbeY n=1 Tax=Enterobacteriaceae endosymbiont of Macroplea appendiculata TaxID=2675790 RepID=UPI001449CCA1|nr:rRNA maturation RNase YbeY [Enterobacteriaceae endosymbiont of Macroplea appendiculata]QJC30904.1 rRNA maturation RNase YbeY [Enterobacteriaceae endosymbiont of Macroplea appendiculata]